MHPVLILLIGVVIVIGGVLVLRLHAFLALTLGALAVGLLTPQANTEQYLIEKNALQITHYNAKTGEIKFKSDPDDNHYLVFRPDKENGQLVPVEEMYIEIKPFIKLRITNNKTRYFASFTDKTFRLKKNDDVVVHVLKYRAAIKDAKKTIGERLAAAFGSTCAKIGILIAMAAIIGKCLLDSGAADRIVRSAMKVTGERGAPVAFMGSSFMLGIPVFFDTVFYLMMPLGKATRMRTGKNYLLYILCIVAGGSMAHSLVPPTPGPLLVASELGVDLGLMILAGCIVGSFTASAGFLYALWVNARAEVPLRESPDFSLAEMEELANRDESQLPPLWLSLMPIVLPVAFIAGGTIVNSFKLLPDDSFLLPIVKTLGNKNIALTIATAIAMAMLVWQKRSGLKELGTAASSALASGGVIILITAAGGAFGGMLQQTGVSGLIRDLPPFSPLVILALAWLITTGIRTAQGSATVAMITAVGILAPFAAGDTLGCHPVYLALAIGCGSKPIAWMNDSGFWVICKMSGMTETEGLKYVTPMSIIMGVVGLLVTLAAAAVLPLT